MGHGETWTERGLWAFAGVALAALVMAAAGALAYLLVDEPAASTEALAESTLGEEPAGSESGLPTEVEPDTGGRGGGDDESVLETPEGDSGSRGGGEDASSSSSETPELPELPPGVELPEGFPAPDAGVDSTQEPDSDSETDSDADAGGVEAP
jgi:hypothetical protein